MFVGGEITLQFDALALIGFSHANKRLNILLRRFTKRLQCGIRSDCVLNVTAGESSFAAFHVVTEVVGVCTVGEHVRHTEFFTALGVRVTSHYHHHAATAHVVRLRLTTPYALDLALGITQRNKLLQKLRITVLDVIHVDHHVIAHLQREVELLNLLTRTGIGRLLGIERGHLMAKRRAVDLHENQPHAVGEIFHQGGLTITGRRNEQQQTHEVRALGIACRTNLLGKVIAHNRQIHFIHQLVPHKG